VFVAGVRVVEFGPYNAFVRNASRGKMAGQMLNMAFKTFFSNLVRHISTITIKSEYYIQTVADGSC